MNRAHRLCVLLGLLLSSSAWAATVTVTSTDDTVAANDAKVTLREAITAINAGNDLGDPDITAQSPGVFGTDDTVNFNIAGPGVHTITAAFSQPTLIRTVSIDGYSQPGATPNNNPLSAGINAVLLIDVHSNTGSVLVVDAPDSSIRGLVLHSSSSGQVVDINASGAVVAGNFIGMDPTGTNPVLGNSSYGIGLSAAADDALVGGPAPADRNLISGIHSGMHMAFPAGPTGVVVQGNYIGPDRSGTILVTGGTGIVDFSNARIVDNLISGNLGGGVRMKDANTVQGNLIGTQCDGTSPLRNESAGGVWIEGNGSLVGGAGVGEANVIAFNVANGVGVVSGATGNLISHNSIHTNMGMEIGLRAESSGQLPLPNDPGDVDTAPGNLGQNYPVITSLTLGAGDVTIAGTLNSIAASTFQIELFSNALCSFLGNGGGQTWLGTTTATTDASGNASFGPSTFAVPAGQAIFTSTATDASGNTSEFSRCTKPTTTALSSSVNPSMPGQSVTFTAIITGDFIVVDGSMQFMDGAVNLGAAVSFVGNGATLTTSALSVGTHPITAVFSGDGDIGITGSTSPVLNQVVGGTLPATTTTTLTSSLNPSLSGQAVRFTATVSGGSNPAGTVQFKDGAVNLGAAVALSGTTATFTTSALSVGTHPVTAVYSGDPDNTGSTSQVLNQIVNGTPPATTTTTLAASLNPSVFGQAVTFTATVNGADPTGTVQINDGATALANATLSGGVAVFTTSALAVGSHPITAAYAGDAANAASTSAVLTQIVSVGGAPPPPPPAPTPTPTLSMWSLMALFGALALFGFQCLGRNRP